MANRSERRKNKNYQTINTTVNENYEMRNLMIVIIVVVLVFALVYLVSTVLIDNSQSSTPTQLPTATIQYENILYTGVFNRSDKEYYVLLHNMTSEQAQTVDYLYSLYKQKTEKLNVYVVNLGDKFNRSIWVEKDSNPKAKKASDLRVLSPTLIKIKNGKITQYVEGIEQISKIFK